jgi:hypothetical protein
VKQPGWKKVSGQNQTRLTPRVQNLAGAFSVRMIGYIEKELDCFLAQLLAFCYPGPVWKLQLPFA